MVIDVLNSYEYFVPKKAAAIRKFTTLIPIRRWSDLFRIARRARIMNRDRPVRTIVGAAVIFLVGASSAFSGEPGAFDTDPQWDALRNRLIPEPAPITRQDFGWRPTQRARVRRLAKSAVSSNARSP